ncbi:hypothetical protein [Rheinheimera sp.]
MQLIFEQPYCRISNLVEKDIAKRRVAVFCQAVWPIRAGQ